MRNIYLTLLLLISSMACAYDLPGHWATPLNTEQVELYKQKQDIVTEIEDRIATKERYVFYNTLNRLYDIGQKDSSRSTRVSPFVRELRLLGYIEVLGLIDSNRNEHFDFSRAPSIKGNTAIIIKANGRPYRPLSADEIEDPHVRADYIKRTKEIKAQVKQHHFEYELKTGWEKWFGAFNGSIYWQFSNKAKNAVDRDKAKVVDELIRTANAPEKTKEKLRFWLTMMVECDKSLVKKAREEGDQTCANYVKELHDDTSALQ